MKKKLLINLSIIFFSLFGTNLLALKVQNYSSAADIQASKELSVQVGKWWADIPDPKPKSITILSVSHSDNLGSNFRELVEANIIEQLRKEANTRVVICQECRRPNVAVKDDRLIITKGAPDFETQINIAKQLEVEAFVTIEVVKTLFNMQFNVIVFNAASSAVFAAQEFSIPNLTIGDSSLQILVSGGLHIEYLPKQSYASQKFEEFPFSLNFTWLENLGPHTKAGLSFGAMLGAPRGYFGFMAPTLGWRINLGSSGFALCPSVLAGIGYRFIPASQIAKLGITGAPSGGIGAFGATAGVGLDLTLGHFFYFGLRNMMFLPLKQGAGNELSIYPGVEIGFSFGH